MLRPVKDRIRSLLKPFTYRIRIAIPEITGRTAMYPYNNILMSFVDKLVKQLKCQHRKCGVGNNIDGYDDVRGKFLEKSIRVYVRKDATELDEKIIWVEM